MKKIAVLAPEIHQPLIEGIQKNAWALSLAARDSGLELDIFTQKSYGEEISQENIKIFYWLNCSSVKIFKYLAWIFNGFKIGRQIRKGGAEMLLCFSLDWSFVWVLLWQRLLNPKTKVRLIIFSSRELHGINRWFFKLIRSGVDHFFVRSKYMQQELLDLKVPTTKITLATVFPKKEKFINKTVRNILPIKKIAYLSNTEASAGIDTVIALAKAIPDLKVILALRQFSPAEELRVQEFIIRAGVSQVSNIEIRRNISDMVAFYQEVEAVILPVNDPINTMAAPLVMLEAISSGCVIFVSDILALAEYQPYTTVFSSVTDLVDKIKLMNLAPETGDFVASLINETQALEIYLKKYE